MPTLLEISEDLLRLEQELENLNGDVEAAGELVNHWLVAAALEAEKLDHYAALIRDLELRAEARKAEARRMAERARVDENRAAFLKERLKERFTEQKAELEQRKRELEGMDTNFDRYARYCISLLSDLPRYYLGAPLPVKQKLTGLIFPGKLVYEEGEYRTTKMNEVLSALLSKKQELTPKEKRTDGRVFGDQSIRVGPTGFEPVTSRV